MAQQQQMNDMQAQLDSMEAEKQAAAQQAAIDAAVAAKMAEQQAAAPPAPAPAPAPAAAPAAAAGGDDAMAQLQKLGEMKAQGLLSDEEFTAAKAKLLA